MIHPYTALKQMKCPWLDSLTAEVKRSIAEYDKFIMAEAEADKCIDFAKESFLYERFVDNNFYGMDYCNIEVLKYFVIFFEQKILYNMIGEWKFTDHDKEMYEHFINTNFRKDRNVVKRIIKYTSAEPVYIGELDCAKDWILMIKDERSYIVRVNYLEWFIDQFMACNDMIRNSKNLVLYADDIRLFTNDQSFNIYDCYKYVGFKFDKDNIISFNTEITK